MKLYMSPAKTSWKVQAEQPLERSSSGRTMQENRVPKTFIDKWQEDELSIVASDEEHSVDGQSLSSPGDAKSPKTAPIDLVRQETQAVMVYTLRYLILALILSFGITMTSVTS